MACRGVAREWADRRGPVEQVALERRTVAGRPAGTIANGSAAQLARNLNGSRSAPGVGDRTDRRSTGSGVDRCSPSSSDLPAGRSWSAAQAVRPVARPAARGRSAGSASSGSRRSAGDPGRRSIVGLELRTAGRGAATRGPPARGRSRRALGRITAVRPVRLARVVVLGRVRSAESPGSARGGRRRGLPVLAGVARAAARESREGVEGVTVEAPINATLRPRRLGRRGQFVTGTCVEAGRADRAVEVRVREVPAHVNVSGPMPEVVERAAAQWVFEGVFEWVVAVQPRGRERVPLVPVGVAVLGTVRIASPPRAARLLGPQSSGMSCSGPRSVTRSPVAESPQPQSKPRPRRSPQAAGRPGTDHPCPVPAVRGSGPPPRPPRYAGLRRAAHSPPHRPSHAPVPQSSTCRALYNERITRKARSPRHGARASEVGHTRYAQVTRFCTSFVTARHRSGRLGHGPFACPAVLYVRMAERPGTSDFAREWLRGELR